MVDVALIAAFSAFVITLNLFGAAVTNRLGLSYGTWFPATFLGYMGFAAWASRTHATSGILVAAGVAATLDCLVVTSVAWSRGWVPEIEDRHALRRALLIGTPGIVIMMVGLALCGILFMRTL